MRVEQNNSYNVWTADISESKFWLGLLRDVIASSKIVIDIGIDTFEFDIILYII